jgi:glycyl-tRNA synthetase alpha chain
MYIQNVESVYDVQWTDGISYGDVFLQNEKEQSSYNFKFSDTEFLLKAFSSHAKQANNLVKENLALPAYEQVLKAAHTFNLLDARGVISVTERADYIGKIRDISRNVAKAYLESRKKLGFPMADRSHAKEATNELDKKSDSSD